MLQNNDEQTIKNIIAIFKSKVEDFIDEKVKKSGGSMSAKIIGAVTIEAATGQKIVNQITGNASNAGQKVEKYLNSVRDEIAYMMEHDVEFKFEFKFKGNGGRSFSFVFPPTP